ncbi:hypothetical protein ACVWXN_006907 [Bradyrhizobium sp. i1.4.4]
MRHRTRPVHVSSRGPEGTAGATSEVAPNELAKRVLVSRAGMKKISRPEPRARQSRRLLQRLQRRTQTIRAEACHQPLLASISLGLAAELLRVAVSPCPSGRPRPAIFVREPPSGLGCSPPSRRAPARLGPMPPVPCRRTPAVVHALFPWRPLPFPVRDRGFSARVRTRVPPFAPPPCRRAAMNSSSVCRLSTCG